MSKVGSFYVEKKHGGIRSTFFSITFPFPNSSCKKTFQKDVITPVKGK